MTVKLYTVKKFFRGKYPSVKTHVLFISEYRCGLIALKLAADILKTSGSLASLPTTGENEIAELLQLSKESCFTYWGEMFSAKDMVSLARMYYGMNYQVGSSGLEDYMKVVNHIVQGYPVLVPYDADRNNEPCLKRGHKAHWVVVTGI